MPHPISVFIAYSHKDEIFKDDLVSHLSPIRRNGLIDDWHDRKIEPGVDWKKEIDEHLYDSQIVLLLISSDFINSEYCYGVELKRALQRRADGAATVVPVIVRDCLWRAVPQIADLQALPTDGRAIAGFDSRDVAYTDVVEGILRALKNITRGCELDLESGSLRASPITQDIDRGVAQEISTIPQEQSKRLVVETSARAVFLLTADRRIAYPQVSKSTWADKRIEIEVTTEETEERALLNSLRSGGDRIVVAAGGRAAVCRCEGNTHFTGDQEAWRLQFAIELDEFQASMEMAFGKLSADDIAEMRAKRILLNEYPPDTGSLDGTVRESFLRGHESIFAITGSVLPELFSAVSKHPIQFLELAWADSVMRLLVSGCVTEVVELRLELSGESLVIWFHGRRRKQYVNAPAFEMKFHGTCRLKV